MFIGHLVVAKQGVKPDTNKVKAMLLTKPPEELSLLRRFIGQSVWLSKHIEDYTPMVGPLRAIVNSYPSKTKGDISHMWLMNPEALNAFGSFSGSSLPVIYTLLFFCQIATYWGVKIIELDPLESNIWLSYVSYAVLAADF